MNGYRVVAVHAHPDDESITMAAALADLARQGADVTVVTCTLGEEGEVIGDEYAQLVNDEADQLGGYRISELRQALATLGVKGRFLGGAGHFRDSGMADSPASQNPRAFVNNTDGAVDLLADIFAEIRPHLVMTYNEVGGYGHPDHIQAHEITHAAAKRVEIPRLVWAVTDRAALERGLAELEVPEGFRAARYGELASVDTNDYAVALDDDLYRTKREAMAAHATQIVFGSDTVYALSNMIAQPLLREEHYQLAAGVPLTGGLLEGLEK